MLQRLKAYLGAPEAKASRTAQVLAFESGGRARWTPRDYAALAREGYLRNAVVHRAVRLIAENAASCGYLVFEGAQERDAHPLAQLLARPNPRQDGTAFLEALLSHLLLAGNAYVEAVALDDAVRELYALRPDRMKAMPGPDGWAEAYEYSVAGRSVRFDQIATPIAPILHLTFFHPLDDHYGLAPIEAAAVAVDAVIQIAVKDMTLTAPPSTPADDERHIVAAGATGAWSGKANAIATWQDGAWAFLVPKAGWCAWSAADAAIVVYDGAAWSEVSGAGGSVGLFGVNTTASVPNRLSVKSNSALFAAIDAADGGTGDMRVQVSKETSGNTASVYFSDNYSGRAEFGLVGSDSFKLKVSNDGSNWIEALVVDPVSGKVAFPRGVTDLIPRGHIFGLTLSTAGASSNFSVAAGEATNATGVDLLALTSAVTKTTAAWAAGSGNGGLDAGSIANATWYHVHLIKRPDTGAVDVLISLSATTPTLPADYTLSRRIGAMKTDGSAKWVKFIQDGDTFTWDVPASDFIGQLDPGTSAILRALSVPPGVNVTALFHARCYTTTLASAIATLFTDPAATDTAPDFNIAQQIGNTTLSPFANLRIRTDTARQIRVRSSFSDSGVGFTLVTDGWIDPRGK